MDNLSKIGRVFLGVAFIDFGIQYFIYGHFVGGLPPGPPWTPGAPFTAYLLGALLIAAGANIAANIKARWSAILLGILVFVCSMAMFIAAPSATIHHGNDRTRVLEPLALSGALWVLAGILREEPPNSAAPPWRASRNPATDKLAKLGLYLFAFSIVIFGIQHFMYAEFIATLITPWIPWKLFWTYFFGVAMLATGIAVVIKVQARLAAILLGIMFLSWVLMLHGVRVVAHLRNGDEWASMFVALGLSGACFIVAKYVSAEYA